MNKEVHIGVFSFIREGFELCPSNFISPYTKEKKENSFFLSNHDNIKQYPRNS